MSRNDKPAARAVREPYELHELCAEIYSYAKKY